MTETVLIWNIHMKQMNPTKYTPDMYVKMGFGVWIQMVLELSRNRGLIWRLFSRDLNSRYRQTILGIAWSFLLPIISVAVFVILTRSRVVNIPELGVPYVVYALFGFTFWGLFSTSLASASNSLVQGGAIIVKINFPKITLVCASFGHALVELLIRLAMLTAVVAFYGVSIHWQTVFLPILIIPYVLLILGLGLILSLLSGVVRDIPQFLTLAIGFFMFLCPVFYPIPNDTIISRINDFNPIAHYLEFFRGVVFTGGAPHLWGYVISSLFSIVFFLVSWRVFFVADKKIAERI